MTKKTLHQKSKKTRSDANNVEQSMKTKIFQAVRMEMEGDNEGDREERPRGTTIANKRAKQKDTRNQEHLKPLEVL